MKKINKRYPITVILSVLTFWLNISVMGQSVWVDEWQKGSAAGFELLMPSIDNSVGADSPTSAVLLYSRIQLNDAISIKIDLPISHFSNTNDFSETDIGNPYLGFGLHEITPGLDLNIGIRFPLAPSMEDASGLITGMLIENYNLGTYIPEAFSITSSFKYRWQNEKGLILNTGGGPDIVIPTNTDELDNEFLFNYYGQVLYGADNFGIGTGITGLFIVTEEDLSFGDRTIHDFGILGFYDFGSATLGSYFRVPLDDDLNDILSFVFGLNVNLSL